MTILNPKSTPGDHDRITWDAHQGHETRLVKLEEYRDHHDKAHEDHVATREQVEKVRTLIYRSLAVLLLMVGGFETARILVELFGSGSTPTP